MDLSGLILVCTGKRKCLSMLFAAFPCIPVYFRHTNVWVRDLG